MEMVKQDIPTLELTATNPANGQTLGSLPYTPAHQIPEMFSQARQAQAVWAEKSFAERRQHMKKMGNYIRDNADELARIVSESNGKTRMDALATEVLPCLMACDWYGKHAASVLKPEYRGPSSLLWIAF